MENRQKQKCKKLQEMALDRGFTMMQQTLSQVEHVCFLDNGEVGMDMEISAADEVIPFARLTAYADQAFADFALEILGMRFE